MRDITTSHLTKTVTDIPVRGFVELRNGETGIVLDGGRVLVGRLRLLTEHASTQLLEQWEKTHVPEACGLAALANVNGPTREQTLQRRRADTQQTRDRKTVMLGNEYDLPAFTTDVIGSGMSDVERKARTEEIARSVPDVGRSTV